ncbi:MAG: DUF5688 family protein, partial [Lachnospiraceae bacterium]|nr:DUF5688 family protein [Lachnospiraceae bacterium]
MNYDEFKTYVAEQLTQYFPEDSSVISVRKVVKNNGMTMDGLCIFTKEHSASPTLYLESYYQKYKEGRILADILSLIIRDYKRGLINMPKNLKNDFSYGTLKERIVMRLVNYEKNQEILKDCPYLPFHDLAITFRWLAHQDEIGISTSLITSREIMHWGITTDQLYEDALSNTPLLFPPKFISMNQMAADYGFPIDSRI